MFSSNPINRLFALGIMYKPDNDVNFPSSNSSKKFLDDLAKILSEHIANNSCTDIVFELKIENSKVCFQINKVIYPMNIGKYGLNLRDIYDTFKNTKLSECYQVSLSNNDHTLIGKFKD